MLDYLRDYKLGGKIMLCKHCGKEILGESKFCNFCGGATNDEECIGQDVDMNEVIEQNSNKMDNPKKKKKIVSIIICTMIVLLGIGAYIWNTGALYSDEKKDELIVESYVIDGKDEALRLVKKFYANDKDAQDDWILVFAMKELEQSNKATSSANSAKYEQFKKDKNISLDAKDVQYDMVNNLDKSFGLYGTAELDDYYNYGFDDDMEADYFCISVRPSGGSYSDEWYVYLHRKSFTELYDMLKAGTKEVMIECKIPQYRYEKNMNNMAMCESARY